MPTKDELKTAQGRNLPDSLINKLKETRKGKNKQVSAVEILGALDAKPMLGAQTDGMLGLALDDLPTPLIARIIELVQPTLSSTPSAFDLAMVCHAFKAATHEFYELSFAADDERLALERQDYQEARVTIGGSTVLEASGVETAYGMQSPTSVTSDLANHRAQLPWISLGLLECLAIHFQSYVRMQLAKRRVRDARSARLPKLQEACTQMSTQIETEVCSASVMVTRSLIGVPRPTGPVFDGEYALGVCCREVHTHTPDCIRPRAPTSDDLLHTMAQGAECEISLADRHSVPKGMLEVQIDGGANTCLIVSPLLRSVCHVKPGTSGSLGLAGASSILGHQGECTLTLYGGAHDGTAPVATGELHGVSVAAGRRDLLGVSCIWTAARIAVLTEPWLLAVHPATG
eukprot:jgi/Chrpa1/25972/Chrysochromulina_OHIO_Genome00026450-RA